MLAQKERNIHLALAMERSGRRTHMIRSKERPLIEGNDWKSADHPDPTSPLRSTQLLLHVRIPGQVEQLKDLAAKAQEL